MKFLFIMPVPCALLLSSCAMEQGDFPSLAKRPYETTAEELKNPPVVAQPLPITALPADLAAQVNRLVQQSTDAHNRFLADLSSARSSVNAARGAAISSEAWVAAQVLISALESTRAPSVDALADIDALYIASLNSEATDSRPGGAALIAQQRSKIEAQVNQQESAFDSLNRSLR